MICIYMLYCIIYDEEIVVLAGSCRGRDSFKGEGA